MKSPTPIPVLEHSYLGAWKRIFREGVYNYITRVYIHVYIVHTRNVKSSPGGEGGNKIIIKKK